MRVVKSGVISFGALAIPVGIGSTVVSSKEPTFTKVHEKCGTPVEVRAPAVKNSDTPPPSTTGETTIIWCPVCNSEANEVVKGFEYAKGQFVTITPEELEAAAAERDTTITLNKFVKANEIRPIMIDKTYWLIPNETSVFARSYGILYQALAETKTAGIGTQTLWGKEHPCAVVPNQDYATGGVLQLVTLHVVEDLVVPDFAAPIPGREEKKVAKEIIVANTGDLDPDADLVSEARRRLQDLIAAKVEGGTVTNEKKETPVPANDVMEALRKTYEEVRKGKSKPKQKATAKAKVK